MPEKRITRVQSDEILRWAVETKQAKPVFGSLDLPFMWLVDGEPLFLGYITPLVEYLDEGERGIRYDGRNFGVHVVCTHRQANELLQAGIVDFDKETQPRAQTA